ncbi:MAG: ABC transporter permease [bacterium]|nr:ABC transporter permease [bacterium]
MNARMVTSQAGWELKTILRNGEQLLLSFILPVLALIALVTLEVADLPSRSDAVAGTIGMALTASAFTGQAIQLAFDRRYGVLRMLSTTPLGGRGLLLGKAGAVAAVVVIQVVVLLVAGFILGWKGTGIAGFGALAVFVVLGTVAFVGLAVLLGGTMRAQAIIAIANLLWILMFAAGGALFPLAEGSWLGWLPPGALGNGLRAALAGSFDVVSALVLAAWGAVLGILAARAMRWD